jgi:hypothetical protein
LRLTNTTDGSDTPPQSNEDDGTKTEKDSEEHEKRDENPEGKSKEQ